MKKICINKLQNRPGGNRGYNNHGDRSEELQGFVS